MKVGSLVKHKNSERGMIGIIVEMVSWAHTEHKTPFILWDDGRYVKCQPGLLKVIQ